MTDCQYEKLDANLNMKMLVHTGLSLQISADVGGLGKAEAKTTYSFLWILIQFWYKFGEIGNPGCPTLHGFELIDIMSQMYCSDAEREPHYWWQL